MKPHTNVELIFAAVLDQVLVAANATCLQGFRTELFIFVRDQMNAEREVLNGGLLPAQIEDSDLRVGYTTTEP